MRLIKLTLITATNIGLCLTTACKHRSQTDTNNEMDKTNYTTGYLKNSELQYETYLQKDILEGVFSDILKLPISKLKEKKYPDYTGSKDQWDISQVFLRYIVPDSLNKSLRENFYEELKTDTVQAIIQRMLDKMRGIE
jgi:hypothetical protein